MPNSLVSPALLPVGKLSNTPDTDAFETAVTLLLLFEIVFRFAADWRHFHEHVRNWVDLGLVMITTVIQLPVIRRSGQPYAWLTLFQIIRIYRVVLALPVTRDLIVSSQVPWDMTELTLTADGCSRQCQRYP